ncbi:MAG: molybdopterin-guanine dinucleotide biosynthesis protein B [Acidobacteria bacterium]|nr:molybdopterin-guanine dinucleotide biosynthesis protein B [Candidatus Sulfomarinibacter sp. MAG AM1]
MENRPPSPPVIAVCGFKDSGKTTLLEGVIPLLCNQGLAVGVIKHDAHGVQVDHRGKDSDSLFRVGADVLLRGPNETLTRRHPSPVADLEEAVDMLLWRHDVVLVEGHKETPLPKIWLYGPGHPPPPPGISDIVLELAWETERTPKATSWIMERVHTAWDERRINGVVLVGGASRRMGRPKQLVVHRGVTLSERAVEAISGPVEKIVFAGSGPVPRSLESLPRLPDSPGVVGPLAGLLSVMRWAPDATWVVAACDMPRVNSEAVAWLIGQRRPGVWAVMPSLRHGRVEPLLAVYEPQARPLLEAQAACSRWGPRHLAANDRVICPTPPAELSAAWENVNTPEEMASVSV